MDKPRVLFLCMGNSARSQMMEAFLRAYTGDQIDQRIIQWLKEQNIQPALLSEDNSK